MGVNPSPKVDIAVAVPSDYPGTFLDFKAELTEKLIAQGMDPADFRITDTATKIDTTDQSNWVVYDHYYNETQYNQLGYTAEQKKTHPYRAADNTKTTGGIIPMSDIFAGGGTISTCRNFITHTYSYDEGGKANMVFAGYGTYPLVDFMYYPATSDVRRTVSFDLDATVIDKHTLQGAGFLLNAGIDESGLLRGFAFYIIPRGSNKNIQQTADAYIYELNNFNAMSTTSVSGRQVASGTIDLGAAKKIRISIDLQKDKTTVQSQTYDSSNNLIGTAPTNIFTNVPLAPTYTKTNYNGFGPIVGYTKHGCSSLTVFKYLDLEMKFESSAFDALNTVQYYQAADQKYFINLVGSNNDPGIPDPTGKGQGQEVAESNKKAFENGINRMNESETFYLSNVDDGFILKDQVPADETTGAGAYQGLGTANGFIASGDSHVDLMAQYIYQNFVEGAKFQRGPVTSALPLANFYLTNKANRTQLMTVHLQHLENAPTEDGKKAVVDFVDKSLPGTSSKINGEDGKIVAWRMRVLDPNGSPANPSWANEWYDDPAKIPNFEFTGQSAEGRYIFELTVRDNLFDEVSATDPATAEALHQSTPFQTYIVAFNDTQYPVITGANTRENVATITLTDTGNGIADDGIIFVEGNQGSGVAAYFVTTDPDVVPNDNDDDPSNDWIHLPAPSHSTSFEVTLDGTDKLYVWSMDECGNVGYKPSEDAPDDANAKNHPAIFQPTRVVVEDPDGNLIKEYYVIGENPVIVLPPDDEIPDPDDPENEWFSGWKTPEGIDVTPGTNPDDTPGLEPGEDNTIVIRPSYSRDYANLVYLGNGGKIQTSSGAQDKAPFQVVSGSSILKKINDQDISASRTGYTFTGWKLLNTADATKADDAGYIANSANVATVTDQIAKKETTDDGTVTRDTYYLVAQWEVGNYTLRFDANDGSLGRTNKIENVAYNTAISEPSLSLPISGSFAPTRPGHFFLGWSEEKVAPSADDADFDGKIFAASSLKPTGVALAATPKMPESDKTVYAVWKIDTSKTLVTFDTGEGGSPIKDQAYGAAETTYTAPFNPTRPGYTFDGWVYADDMGSYAGQSHPGTGEAIPTDLRSGTIKFVAQWKANTNTRYTIDYYVNSGNKNAEGRYLYTKVTHDGATKTLTATTGDKVSIPNDASIRVPEISFHGLDYWYNPDNALNVFEGTVTGNPTLSLRLYYDRYLNINVTKSAYSTGDGEVTSAVRHKEGTSPTATWKAAPGSYVSRVTVNGVVRDDLLKTGSYTPENGLWNNENVVVKFDKDTTPGATDPDTPVVEPDPDNPIIDQRRFTISTRIHGCTHNSTITPSKIVKPDENMTVEWNLCNQCTYLHADVDGQPVMNLTSNKLELTKINRDHTVDIYVTPKTPPTLGAERESGSYTITVNRYGGDSDFKLSSTQKILVDDAINMSAEELAKKWTFEWDRGDSIHRIYAINVNAKRQDLGMQVPDAGSLELPVKRDCVVDVYFYDIRETPGNPNTPDDPDDPDYPDSPDGPDDPATPPIEYIDPDLSRVDEWYRVNTIIEGGAGTIDPSFVAKKSEDGEANPSHTVRYTLENSTDYGAEDYVYYEVKSVTVNNEDYPFSVDDKEGSVEVTLDTETDANVKVTVEPIFVDVKTNKVTFDTQDKADGSGEKEVVLANHNNGGKISASRTLGKYGDYTNIFAEPAPNYRLDALDVFDTKTGVTTTYVEDAGKWIVKSTASTPVVQVEALAEVLEDSENEVAEVEDPSTDNSKPIQTGVANGVNDVVVGGVNEVASGDGSEQDEPDANDSEESSSSEEPANDPATEAEAPATPVEDASDEGTSTTEEVAASPMAMAADLLFGVEEAYAVPTRADRPAADTFNEPSSANGKVNLGFANITADKEVTAYFVKDDAPRDEAEKTIQEVKENPAQLSNVTLTFEGLKGNVKPALKSDDINEVLDDGTGVVPTGGSTTVRWGSLPNYEVESVTVNGVTQTVSGNDLTLNNIPAGNVNVVVTFKQQTSNDNPRPVPPSGIAKKHVVSTSLTGLGGLSVTPTKTIEDGANHTVTLTPNAPELGADGQQVNIPYVLSYKVNGVEQPAYQGIVTGAINHAFNNLSEDQKVEIHTILMNEDANDDGKPDYNIDTDGDGEPDLNVDTDGDGLPDLNVDTDGDGEPDVNIDTDGDGKPDENIVDRDTDGDPENVDPLNPDPVHPNVNVVVPDPNDPDKKIVLNEDTDGDGKPDKNIVDEDLDGKPDPVDPKNPPKPNVNVVVPDPNDPDKEIILNHDTDGDGIPDLDIVDADGDGKPDSIDPTDPNPPVPNVNVDTDKDGKPDLFIDVDHDFLPDVNIDTDKDGRPDINIDTDGDLEPDVNIDTDGTDTWYPSSRGGNADKIWKPYKNIDTGDGEGPIHTDTTAAVDEDHNGVDDRWKPEHNTAAANGFEYDTMAADWVDDGDLSADPGSKDPGAKDPDNGSDPSKSDKGDKSDSNDKSDKSDNDKGKTKLAQTSDDLLPSMALTGMMALTALAVCFWAWRRGNRSVRGKHAR